MSGRHRPVPSRPVAVIAAVAACVLATTPWTGAWVAAFDTLSPAWPAAPVLALAALALARPRGAGAVLALGTLALCVPTLWVIPGLTPRAQAGVRLRVVTHNVWTDNADPAGTARALAESGADLILLQEVDGRFAEALPLLRRNYPHASPCRHGCALAILSRWPIERQRYRFLDGRGRQTGPGLVRARVHLPGGIVFPVATVHLPRGRLPGADLRQRAGLAEAARDADMRGMILAGDFNLVPWSARLRWLDDALAPMRRATATFSYPARLGDHDFPVPLVPIDHVYVGSDWAVAATHRLGRTGSDHYPVAVDLIWQGSSAMVTSAP